LLHVVGALRSAGGFTSLLNSGQQQGNQNANDGNDHKKLNQGKT
jgi:hypothetical protein